MKKNPDSEENYYSKTTEGRHEISPFYIRIMNCLWYADRRFYENLNYFDLMAIVLTCPFEVTFWWLSCRSENVNDRIPVQMQFQKRDNVIFQNDREPNIKFKKF